jgi:hypothetical protein
MHLIAGHEKPAAECIRWARHHYETAAIGLEAVTAINLDRSLHGAYIVVTFGRGVTDGVRRLRKHIEGFEDEWYKPRTAEMSADPAMKYCYGIRNDILHELRIDGQKSRYYSQPFTMRIFATEEEARNAEPASPALIPAQQPQVVFTAPSDIADQSAAAICTAYMARLHNFLTSAEEIVRAMRSSEAAS